MARKTVIAVDLGAESGRVMAVHFDGRTLELEELHRFANPVTSVRDTLYWDVLHLWREVQAGIEEGRTHRPASIGVDTWGVDFALLDRAGNLLANPVMYRDSRTDSMLEAAYSIVPQRAIFNQTGIQFLQINTLYQLLSMVRGQSPLLDTAATFLTIPDLLNYWLTGEKVCEFTNATTTQMLDPRARQWATGLLDAFGIPTRILPEIVPPGTRLGNYAGIPIIAPATHDTGSAVAAVPAGSADFAYISSGTWSLVGLEVPQAIVDDAAFAANVTNEGGIENTYRLLKNITGMWILQQCRATWRAEGHAYSYADLVRLGSEAADPPAVIDVDDRRFLPAGDHPALIRDYCQAHGEPVPRTHGAIVRCVLASMALRYRAVLEDLGRIAGQAIEVVHIVGGGSQNSLLNQLAADITGIPVAAGPVEATVLGNAVVQLIALGELRDIQEARQIIAEMGVVSRFAPRPRPEWDAAYARLRSLTK